MSAPDIAFAGPEAAGPLSRLSRSQYAALAAMRWQMFRNGMRTSRGALELGARAITYILYGSIGLGLSAGLGAGAYAMASSTAARFLPALFWAVFLVWQMLPVMLASFQEQFDLGILLRFPLGFRAYYLLYVIFGLIDVSTITGGLCCLGLWVGLTIARPALFAWSALALIVFATFNILLVRAIFAWIDRWLAQRRTREIVGAIFLLFVLSLQLLNPALHQSRHSRNVSREERMAERRKTAGEMWPWLAKANAVQRWLPAGLAAQAVKQASEEKAAPAFGSVGILGIYALAAGAILAWRLRAEFAGESLGEAPSRAKGAQAAERRSAGWFAGGSGPIAAIVEKELRAMLRTMPLLYAVGAPLLLVLVFSGVFVRNGAQTNSFPFSLPVCLVYAQLGFTQLFYNSLGAEGTGIQLYFLSPTPMRTVMLAKNLFHSMLFFLTASVAAVLAIFRLGLPPAPVLAASAAWILFALPCNLAAGNIFSLSMPYRLNPGRLSRQRGSQASSLLSLLVQMGEMAVGALVLWLCWFTDRLWLATPILLALAVIALVIWDRGLRNADALASRNKENLIAVLAKTE
jgi:ABC-2 type transport system permease protein